MITIRLRFCSLLLVLVFALISCQQAEPSPEVIATETTIPSSPTEETKEESTATPPPESTSPAEEESYPAPQAESTTVSEEESYPAPQAETSTTGYPSPDGNPTVELMMVPDPYPGPDEITPTPAPSSPTLLSAEKFSLAPLQAGDTEVQGRGPAGLPIRLVDVTLAGDLIVTGQIQDDGSFTLQLDKPLISNQRVGLKVDSLQGTPFADQEDVVMQDAVLLMGENAFDIPAVGLVLTSQRVP